MKKISVIILSCIITMPNIINSKSNENNLPIFSKYLSPTFNLSTNDYMIRNCHNKNTELLLGKEFYITYKNNIYKNKIKIKTKKDQLINIFVKNKDNTINKEIFIRCLPDDFPKLLFTSKSDDNSNLYTFATAKRKNVNNWMVENGYYIIADKNGVPIWYMKALGSPMIIKVDNNNIYTVGLPPGMTPSYGARKGSAIIKTDLAGKLIKKIKPKNSEYVIDTHGFEILNNKNYLVITVKLLKNYDLSKYTKNLTPYNLGGGGVKQCDVTNTTKATVAMPYITEIDQDGNIIKSIQIDKIITPEESQLLALSDIDYTGKKPNCVVNIYHPVNLSLSDDEKKYILTNRFTSATYIIDKAEEKVIAKLGGVKNINSLEIISDPLGSRGPIGHHGGFLKNNQLIVLDNRRLPSESVRAVIYDLNLENKKAIYNKSYTPPNRECELFEGNIICLTYSMGTALFLEENSVLATWGFRPNSPNMGSHFDNAGNLILNLQNNEKNQTTYQINYINKNNINLNKLRTNASSEKSIPLPFENKLGWSLQLKDSALTGPGN
jgi:hypothetical protein